MRNKLVQNFVQIINENKKQLTKMSKLCKGKFIAPRAICNTRMPFVGAEHMHACMSDVTRITSNLTMSISANIADVKIEKNELSHVSIGRLIVSSDN